MVNLCHRLFAVVVAWTLPKPIHGFLPRSSISPLTAGLYPSPTAVVDHQSTLPAGVRSQRNSVGTVQTMGLFGLGFAEIGIILVAVGVVLGPETLGRLARGSASRAKEYQQEISRVPEEFQKGLEEGEIESRSRKARRVKAVRQEDE